MSVPEDTPVPPDPSENPELSTSGKGLTWATVLLSCLIIVPVLSQWLPSEVALWKQAAARNQWLADDRDRALALSHEALSWDAHNSEILTEQAEWLAELSEYDQAIDIYEKLIEGSVESELTIQWRMQLCNHYNSRAIDQQREATETWQQWQAIDQWYADAERELNLPVAARANLHNNRAYLLAVGNTHLEEALASSNLSLDLFGGEVYCLYSDPLFFVQFAYQAYEQRNYKEALQHLNTTVERLDRTYALLLASTPTITWKDFEKREIKRRLENLSLVFGNILLFRVRCHELMDLQNQQAQPEQQNQREVRESALSNGLPDLERATILGASQESFSPEVFSSDLLLSPQTQALIPMALDTRGFLYYQQGYPQLALLDLEVAVQATEFQLEHFEDALENEKHRIANADLVRKQQHERQKNLAVILYHRSLAYDATHQVARAKRDRQRIADLGFSASPLLH